VLLRGYLQQRAAVTVKLLGCECRKNPEEAFWSHPKPRGKAQVDGHKSSVTRSGATWIEVTPKDRCGVISTGQEQAE
jgi:hypothetical protein